LASNVLRFSAGDTDEYLEQHRSSRGDRVR
jgi:hypothetical protein